MQQPVHAVILFFLKKDAEFAPVSLRKVQKFSISANTKLRGSKKPIDCGFILSLSVIKAIGKVLEHAIFQVPTDSE